MTEEDAKAGIAYLAMCTPGWKPEIVNTYVQQCTRFTDPATFHEAMKTLAMRWSKISRPLPYDITIAYQEAERAKALDDHYALTEGHSTSEYPTFEEGVAIEWEAYQAECHRQKREPNRSYFEKWLNQTDSVSS